MMEWRRPILQQVQDERMGRLRPPYRPSRVSGNPAAGQQRAGLFNTVGIPAYAGMTVGDGNDGREGGGKGRLL